MAMEYLKSSFKSWKCLELACRVLQASLDLYHYLKYISKNGDKEHCLFKLIWLYKSAIFYFTPQSSPDFIKQKLHLFT